MYEVDVLKSMWLYTVHIESKFSLLLQYGCCLKYDITTERTLHIITHYIDEDLTVEGLRSRIEDFASVTGNMKWIQKVGAPVFEKMSTTARDYITDLVQGTIKLDQLALLLVARVLNIHIVILLKERYWST